MRTEQLLVMQTESETILLITTNKMQIFLIIYF